MEPTGGMILIPAYREEARIGAVVRGARQHVRQVAVVDDGSPDHTADEAGRAGAIVLKHTLNQGKGAALRTGFEYARGTGAAFVLTMDGDGQHAANDIPRFLEAYAEKRFPVIVGNRMESPGAMPPVRRLTNWFMSALLSRKMGQRVPDTQNGFRLYRTDVIPEIQERETGFAAESEILLELAAIGVRIGSVPVSVIYDGEKSKISPWRDTFRFLRMLRAFDRRNGSD